MQSVEGVSGPRLGLRWFVGVLAIGLWARPAFGLTPGDLPKCPKAAKTCVAVSLWLPSSQADGWRGFLYDQLDEANDQLAVIGAGVQVTEMHDLPKSDAEVTTLAQRSQLGRRGQQVPLRWFVVDRLNDAGDKERERRGVTCRAGNDFWIIQSKVTDNDWVFAHELGHVLGLPHSTEARSIMNKALQIKRAWALVVGLVFTDRERPVMRRTLARLLADDKLRTVGPSRD